MYTPSKGIAVTATMRPVGLLLVLAASAAMQLLGASQAHAATCASLTTGPVLSGGSNLALTCQTSGGGSPNLLGGTQVNNLPTVPGAYFYGHGYASATTTLVGSPSPGFGFYDDYVFTIGGASANSITSTISLGSLSVTNLQVRLYSLASNALPTLGVPAGTVYSAWTAVITIPGITGAYAVIDDTVLNPGTYVLEVRGNTGSAGGSYSGTLNLQPVPLPAAAWLLLSGLAGLATVRRRQRG
jgi:hypothetical protein